MRDKGNGLSRREFMELTAGATAFITLGGPAALAATPKKGGTVRCGMAFLIQYPEPHRYQGTWAVQTMALCYEGLTMPTPKGIRERIAKEKGPGHVPPVQPMLADAWEVEKGGTRYVFHLKKGVKFHTGKELDSEDVKWTWARCQNPKQQAGSRKLLQYLKTVETPDKQTVVANLEKPFPAFLIATGYHKTCILPKDCAPKDVQWGITPTWKPPTVAPPGTGPFRMVKFQQKNEAVFERFDGYRIPGLPHLDRVVYKVISNDNARTMALRAGDVDYIWGAEYNWANQYLKGRKEKLFQLIDIKKDNLMLYTPLGEGTITIYLNCHPKRDTPFKDARVRRALAYCIDKKKLAEILYGDFAIPWDQGFHPETSAWAFEDIQWPEVNIDKAKSLLKEAGYPNGLDVEFKITPSWGKNDLMAQIVQQMARPAGFRIKITPIVGAQYWLNFRKYSYHMMVWTLGSGDDPFQGYYSFLHTDPVKPYLGYAPVTGLKDPALDKLLDAMATEPDVAKRRALFKRIVRKTVDEMYWIPYMRTIWGYAWNKRIKNLDPFKYFFPEEGFREAWLET